MKNARSIPPTGIRMPDEMKTLLKELAKREDRSLNSEIIRRLKDSLITDGAMSA
ncbi:Arc family DNA-binding protein [Yersinia hibernica]|uniref:Arc family DNA-binding protein n=1 Tax=Yersinia hibernica TaxID=2339259 RepID=UPI00119F87A8|nr:Arc family DNA-binding protein [Yersinia hibernica]